jgi:hypothetical protein
MSDSRFAVKRYLALGLKPIPIPKGEKGPRIANWQNTDFDETAFSADDNIGIRLGEPSGDLVDVDLDCHEAIIAARELLLHTQWIFGRASKPASHYLYISAGFKTEQFKDTDGSVLVEGRSTGGQTVFPPSVHPSGEVITAEIDKEFGRVDAAGLRDAVRLVATAALLSRHWPAGGSRHKVAQDAAGFLASRGVGGTEIEMVIKLAAQIAGDPEVRDRAKVARDSASKFTAGGKTTGLPSLEDSLGADVTKRLRAWYGGTNESVVDELNAKYFVVRLGSNVVIGHEDGDETVFMRERDVSAWFKDQRVAVGQKASGRGANATQVPVYRTKFDIWYESSRRRKYRTVIFGPPPRDVRESDYNLWKGFAVEPDAHPYPERRCAAFLRHTRDVICSGSVEHFDYMLDLLALTVQQPGYPSEIAVTLRGHQGTGKGVFIRYFGDLFGRHYIQVDKPEHITGKFNQHLSGKVVVFADEAIWSGDKRDVGPLKRLITEDTLTIERKGIDAVKEQNCVHLFMATNEKWSTPAGFHDRRFFVLDVSNAKRQDSDYFAPIYAEQKAGGPSALLAFLQARTVDRKRLRKAPKTDALRVQQEYGMSPDLKWWKSCLFDETIGTVEGWPKWVSVEDLHYSYLAWCDRMRVNRRIDKNELVAVLRGCLPEFTTSRQYAIARDEKGQRIPGEKVQRRGWDLPSLEACRAAFDATSGVKTPWAVGVSCETLELTGDESPM